MRTIDITELAENGLLMGEPLHASVEETHISWVLLTARYALKIKKPLKLSFLDFSTLAKRLAFCHKEVMLNSRFSSIYLGVIPVSRKHGQWLAGGNGDGVRDYAVLMKRMKSAKRMDVMLVNNAVSDRHISKVAGMLASFHRSARRVQVNVDPGDMIERFNDIAGVSAGLDSRSASTVQRALQWSRSTIASLISRMRARDSMGWYRDLHGDLHCANIFLYQRPVFFDCIEFNDRLRCIDVLDELGFLCMDLEAFGADGFSRLLVSGYERRMRCFDGSDDRRLWNFYKCYRANIRAKVHAMRYGQATGADEKQKEHAAMSRYLNLMERYIEA